MNPANLTPPSVRLCFGPSLGARLVMLVGLLLSMGVSWADPLEIRDDTGQMVRLNAPAQRIISLAPHLTENLFAAGAGAKVIGVVEYSDFPPTARAIPRIGGYSRLDLEQIAALKPDLVIAWETGNQGGQIARLKALGLKVFVTQTNGLEDIAQQLETFGKLAGTEAKAAIAAREFRTRLNEIRQKYSGLPRVRVFYQVWKQPLITVGNKQIISSAIRLCGGENVFGNLEPMAPHVSVEAVLAEKPEAIIASGMDNARPEWLDDWRQWKSLPAVVQDQLHFIPPELIQRHTPRLLDGTEQLCVFLEKTRKAYAKTR